MVVGVEPTLSPHGPEGAALALTASGVLVLNGPVGLQLAWLVLVAVVAVARRSLGTLPGLGGPDGGDGVGAGGGDPRPDTPA